jgi:DNA-binding GntR family transcriptional regulator
VTEGRYCATPSTELQIHGISRLNRRPRRPPVLGIRTVPADDAVAEQLGREPGDPVVERRRVRTADDRHAVYSVDRTPADMIDERRDRDAPGGSIYALLATRGHPLNHGGAIAAPASADRDRAGVLEVQCGTLLQHLQQIDVDAAARHVLYSLA